MFSLESPHRGDFNEYTQYTIFNIKTKITLNYPKSAAIGFFRGTQKRVQNSRGKRAIWVRAIEVVLYMVPCVNFANGKRRHCYFFTDKKKKGPESKCRVKTS